MSLPEVYWAQSSRFWTRSSSWNSSSENANRDYSPKTTTITPRSMAELQTRSKKGFKIRHFPTTLAAPANILLRLLRISLTSISSPLTRNTRRLSEGNWPAWRVGIKANFNGWSKDSTIRLMQSENSFSFKRTKRRSFL